MGLYQVATKEHVGFLNDGDDIATSVLKIGLGVGLPWRFWAKRSLNQRGSRRS